MATVIDGVVGARNSPSENAFIDYLDGQHALVKQTSDLCMIFFAARRAVFYSVGYRFPDSHFNVVDIMSGKSQTSSDIGRETPYSGQTVSGTSDYQLKMFIGRFTQLLLTLPSPLEL